MNRNETGAPIPEDYIVFNGELNSRKKLITRGSFFLAPGLIWVVIFLTLPLLSLAVMSFAQRGTYGDVDWTFSLANLKRLLGFSFFGWSADNLLIIWRSIVVAVVSTFLCVVMSYPLAIFIATRSKNKRGMWLALLLVPFWTNLVIRTYAWLLVLAPQMPLTKLAAALGLISRGTALYPSAFAVYLGMVSTFLPFVTLPLYASVEKMDWSILEAISDLYGGGWRVFRHGILPQTMSGLSVGITLTLIPAMGMFVVPDMLSGAKYMLVGNLIQQQFGTSRDWPFGAMVSLTMMAMTILILFITRKKEMTREGASK